MRIKLFFMGICLMVCGVLMPSVYVAAQEQQEVQTAHISDVELQNIVEEEISSLIVTRATQYNISWTVPAETRYVTGSFSKSEGSSIYVVVSLSKSGWAGIIDASGNITYVSGKSISKSFSIDKAGTYRVFVQNNGSSSLTASGYYQK